MADTTFVNYTTPIVADWLQDVNNLTYNIDKTGVNQGASLVGLKLTSTAAVARTVWSKLDNVVFATDITGVDSTGASSSSAGIQAYLDTLTNTSITSAFPGEGVRIWFPPGTYLWSTTVTPKTANVTFECAPGSAVIEVTSGTYTADSGSEALGKWVFAFDSVYLGVDVYNCHVKGFILDMNNVTDVGGVLFNGGRNGSGMQSVQWTRFYSNLFKLGKSTSGVHAVCQGMYFRDCLAIWSGSALEHTTTPDGVFFDISAANECTFDNITAVSSSTYESIGCGFYVGSGTYQCGGNIFIGCTTSNFFAAHVGVASTAGYVVGENVTCNTTGFKGTIGAIAAGLLKITVRIDGTSKYVPVVGTNIVGDTSTTTQAITSVVYGAAYRLRNAWGTKIVAQKVFEHCVAGVHMHYSGSAASCTQNSLIDPRHYNFTSSAAVVYESCQYNRASFSSYTIPSAYLTGCDHCSTEYYGVSTAGNTLADFQSTATTNVVYEYVTSGGQNAKTQAGTIVYSGDSGNSGVRVSSTYGELFAGSGKNAQIRTNGTIRVTVTSGGSMTFAVPTGQSFGVTYNGTSYLTINTSGQLLMPNLPTSSAGLPAGGLWKDTAAGNVVKAV